MGAAIEVLTWGTPDPPQWYHFSSRHPGVILFALGDGAVRGVRKGYVWPDANFWTTVYLGGWNDGRVTDTSTVMP
jgi:hypothetical protein